MEHEQELSLAEVLRISTDAATAATEEGITSFWVNEPLTNAEGELLNVEGTIVVDGVHWDLMGVHGDLDDENEAPWQWNPEGYWEDISRY